MLKLIKKFLRRRRIAQRERTIPTLPWAKTGPLTSEVLGGGGCLWPLDKVKGYKP